MLSSLPGQVWRATGGFSGPFFLFLFSHCRSFVTLFAKAVSHRDHRSAKGVHPKRIRAPIAIKRGLLVISGHPEVVAFGSGQGRRAFETAGLVRATSRISKARERRPGPKGAIYARTPINGHRMVAKAPPTRYGVFVNQHTAPIAIQGCILINMQPCSSMALR